MVQRLARGPFKAEIRVRFPLALPKPQKTTEDENPRASVRECDERL